jgi:hypothetical protein
MWNDTVLFKCFMRGWSKMFPGNVHSLAATATFLGATVLFTNHIQTDAATMPAGKKVCPHCGILVSVGWGWQSHQKMHLAEDGKTLDAEDVDGTSSDGTLSEADDVGGVVAFDDGGGMDNVREGPMEVYGRKLTVEEYLDTLSAEGRLCPAHVLQYMLWGKGRSTDEGTMTTYLFLRAMYGGTGASRRQGQEMLRFIHSLNAVPAGMPTQIRDCWSLVAKVMPECLRNI